MNEPFGTATPGEQGPRDEYGLRRLLEIVDTELADERRSHDSNFTAQQKLDARLRSLNDAVRRAIEGEF
jgi:hypothetical protein